MPLWGRNDQSVTANSTTTAESSSGAPIGLGRYVAMGSSGTAAVTHATNAHFGNTSPGSRANVDVALFENVTPSQLVNGIAVGIFGVSATEQSNNVVNKSPEHPAHAGWNLRTAGTGGIASITYTGNAVSYSNGDQVIVSSPVAGGNAQFTMTTNATGGALVLKLVTPGFGFTAVNAAANAVYANSLGGSGLGSNAVFLPVAGGRAGRIHYETIVAMGSLGAQTAPYGTPAKDSDGSDSAEFPGT